MPGLYRSDTVMIVTKEMFLADPKRFMPPLFSGSSRYQFELSSEFIEAQKKKYRDSIEDNTIFTPVEPTLDPDATSQNTIRGYSA